MKTSIVSYVRYNIDSEMLLILAVLVCTTLGNPKFSVEFGSLVWDKVKSTKNVLMVRVRSELMELWKSDFWTARDLLIGCSFHKNVDSFYNLFKSNFRQLSSTSAFAQMCQSKVITYSYDEKSSVYI